jgi:hypothetical protein
MRQVQEWYSSIDQGLKRTARDAIRAQGLMQELDMSERHAGRLSGAVKLIATGFADMTAGSATQGKSAKIRARSNAVISDLMRAWAFEGRHYFSLIQGGEPANLYLFERAPVIACGLLTLRYAPDKASNFWQEIARDDALSRHDPRKRFLVWLRENKEKPAGVARGFAVAWRNYLDETELKLIRFDPTRPIQIRGVPLEKEIAGATETNPVMPGLEALEAA